jgi:UDP-N-acetyl-D-glucosamine dehydrogenase
MERELESKFRSGQAYIGIIGLGYVGLPLVLRFAEQGFRVLGFDSDPDKVKNLNAGHSYIKHIPSEKLAKLKGTNKSNPQFEATSDMRRLSAPDALIICVPTPLNRHREPNMQYVEQTAHDIAQTLRPGQLISLESTTYPGTTEEIMLPKFAHSGLRVGEDFFLVFSPEREDPGNPHYDVSNTPKIVGGVSKPCANLGKILYEQIVKTVVPVSSTQAAEMAKLFENIYRAVNIALVNELKVLCHRMDIDIYEVISAAKTKPFGFQAFYPGPGLGGHCIPIDPFYLTWKAREFDFNTRFIELAGEINTYMPYYVVERTVQALNERGRAIQGAQVLIIGIAYKKDVDDMRESPSLKLIDLLQQRKIKVDYHDPYIPIMPKTRRHQFNMNSIPLTAECLRSYDAVIIATDHSNLDYESILANSALVVDTRNAIHSSNNSNKLVRA